MRVLRNIFILAVNSFSEVARHRFFYGLTVAALMIMGLGVVLGPLSMSEEQRITMDFGLFSTQIVLIVVAILFGSLSITRDIEKKILMTLITRSLTRSQYILGKFLGISLVLFTATCLLGIILSALFYYFSAPINALFFKALWGIYLEALVLLSLSVLFSAFTSTFLIICYSFCCFIIGHWIDTLKMLLEKSKDPTAHFFSEYVVQVFPNFEKFNWRPHVVYQEMLPIEEVFFYSFYAFSWIALLLTVAIQVFNRKDFV